MAAFPGQNGKIAFGDFSLFTINPDGTARAPLFSDSSEQREHSAAWAPSGEQLAFTRTMTSGSIGGVPVGLFLINADGSGLQQFPNAPVDATTPAWSPNSQWIVYASRKNDPSSPKLYDDLYAIKLDGTGDTRLTDVQGGNIQPAWSPDGTRIAFTSNRDGNAEIYVMNADGSNQTRLTNSTSWESDPNWSPNGSRIAFSEWDTGTDRRRVWTMSPDGTGMTPVTDLSQVFTDPAWSPDGSRIAALGSGDLYTMNPDGTEMTQLTQDGISEADPDWQPIPYPGYARPKSADPVRVSLVPAFTPCTSPNREHGPPLAYGSCNPPAPESSELTVGTGMSGFVRYRAVIGNPATLVDEADVAVRVQIADVREQATLTDYAGAVRAESTARLVDRGSGGPATVVDVLFPLLTQCTPTQDETVGSDCSLNTTLDALIPDAIAEGRRTVMQLNQVSVADGGPDADPWTEPNTVLLRQGLFVP
jgi:Tol biopolymer transport system component